MTYAKRSVRHTLAKGTTVIRFHHTIEIGRPVQDVFGYLADFTNVPSWNYFVRQVHQLTPGPVTLGTVYDQIRRTDQQRYRVSAYEPPRTVAVTTLPGERPSFHRQFTVERAAGGGSLIQDRWELDTGHPALVQRLAAPRVRSGVAANLAVLKELLEQGHARLPDGRLVELEPRGRR